MLKETQIREYPYYYLTPCNLITAVMKSVTIGEDLKRADSLKTGGH